MWQTVVDKVELMVGAKDRSLVVEAVSLGDVVSQDAWVRMSMVRVKLDVETVGEDLLGTNSCYKVSEEERHCQPTLLGP